MTRQPCPKCDMSDRPGYIGLIELPGGPVVGWMPCRLCKGTGYVIRDPLGDIVGVDEGIFW